MAIVQVWPQGEIAISEAVIGGETMVGLDFPDPASGNTISIRMRVEHFVSLTDTCRMYADELVNRQIKPRR